MSCLLNISPNHFVRHVTFTHREVHRRLSSASHRTDLSPRRSILLRRHSDYALLGRHDGRWRTQYKRFWHHLVCLASWIFDRLNASIWFTRITWGGLGDCLFGLYPITSSRVECAFVPLLDGEISTLSSLYFLIFFPFIIIFTFVTEPRDTAKCSEYEKIIYTVEWSDSFILVSYIPVRGMGLLCGGGGKGSFSRICWMLYQGPTAFPMRMRDMGQY